MVTSGTRNRLAAFAALMAIPTVLGAGRVLADWYTPDAAPTMDTTIYNKCVATLPLPTNRATIGIGEQVDVWISEAEAI